MRRKIQFLVTNCALNTILTTRRLCGESTIGAF